MLKARTRKIKPAKRMKVRGLGSNAQASADTVEALFDRLAEEEEAMTRYEHGQEVG
jgi:hypothetical protein